MTRTRSALARAALATLLSGAASAAPPVLDPVTQKFIDGLAAAGGPPIYKLSPENAREVLAGAQAIPVAKLPAAVEDTTFPVGPTSTGVMMPNSAASTAPRNEVSSHG